MFIIEMTGSTITAKLSRGFVGEYEVDLLLMAISISLLLTGPGRISVEWNVLKRDYFQKVSKQYYSNYRRHKSEFLRT
jgi:putative oxidoreductase